MKVFLFILNIFIFSSCGYFEIENDSNNNGIYDPAEEYINNKYPPNSDHNILIRNTYILYSREFEFLINGKRNKKLTYERILLAIDCIDYVSWYLDENGIENNIPIEISVFEKRVLMKSISRKFLHERFHDNLFEKGEMIVIESGSSAKELKGSCEKLTRGDV